MNATTDGLYRPMADVIDFHRAFGVAVRDSPGDPGHDVAHLRTDLIMEECDELLDGIKRRDMEAIADGAIDLIYVTLGALAAFGIDPGPVWDAVHAANMAKLGGPVRQDGKRMKPPGWTPPDVAGCLAGQRRISESYPPGDAS